MAEQSSGPLGLPPSVWAVIIVGLAGALAATQHPFQDVRPGDSTANAYRHSPSEDQDVEARQWEDPFTAVAIARRIDRSKKSETAVTPSVDALHDIERLSVDRLKKPNAHTLVLGTMVPGAPYADDVETRRRTRYAVLAGLFQEGYVPDDDEHIGYISLPKLPADRLHAHDMAAYEWFRTESSDSEAPTPRILLLWLDQDAFQDEPLARFSAIVERIAGNSAANTVSAAIIGPADSGGLKAMSNELDDDAKSDCKSPASPQRDIAIYSPRATALDWLIVSDAVKARYPETENDPHADHFHDRCPHVKLYRTVASDFTVVRALYRELKYRGVQNVGEIALVTERDTLYSRLISRYFGGCEGTPPITDKFTITKFSEGVDDPDIDDIAEDNTQPQCFSYLRGLDGLVPPAPDEGDTAQTSDAKSAPSGAGRAPIATESASGQGQLDYLRRLTNSLAWVRDDPACGKVANILALSDPTQEGQLRCGRHIKAIGVIGSDIYDKLLVLQALRLAFPRYIFFTTGLDARLTDTQNLPWTREMVIGSSLGLALRPELQGSVPPFRDSFQAATYYSAMQAAQRFAEERAETNDQKHEATHEASAPDLAWTRRPHVFEIGRTQAFDLSAYKDSNVACARHGECRSIAAWRQQPLWSTGSISSDLAFAAVVVLLVTILAVAAMGITWTLKLITRRPPQSPGSASPARRLFTATTFLVITACVSVMAWSTLVETLTNGGRRIPAPIFSGASHWTASILEALSILIVITLVVRGQRKLRTNATSMLHEFGFSADVSTLVGKYRDWLLMPNNYRRWRERLWFPIKRLSGNKKDPLVKPHAAPTPLDDLYELEILIAQYLYRGRAPARIVRVTIATVISSCALLALEYILVVFEFNLGVSFVNGFAFIDFHYVERGIESFISFFNLLAIQFLIFWVADALLLTRSFVLALSKDRPEWPPAVIDRYSIELDLPTSWTAMWLDLRLIAWRTGRVANLIWYPSLMIAAMAVAAVTVEFGELGFASNPIALFISAAFVVSGAVMMRRCAEAWRTDVLFRLDNGRLKALGKATSSDAPIAQLDRLCERVQALSEGAFAPYSQQPLVRAVLVPAITYGATAGLQFLHGNLD